VKRIVAQCILDVIEELGDLLVGFLGHAIQDLLDEMWLITPTRLDDQFAW
jgi:hypothetical protein